MHIPMMVSKEELQNASIFLKNHPEILYSAAPLFNAENYRSIIKEKVDVPGGVLNYPRNTYDITDDDIEAIIKRAIQLIDPVLEKYNEGVAIEDALHRAIETWDKYAGKINYNTYILILDNLKSRLKENKDE